MRTVYSILYILLIPVSAIAQDYWVQVDSVKGPARSVAAAFEANGIGYVVTGFDGGGFMRRLESYNPLQNDWDSETSLGGLNGSGLARGSACAFAVLNKGYVCTGQGDWGAFLKDNWEYDPASDTWTQKADFPGTARRAAVSFVIDNIAYVGTGQDATGLKKDFYKFDPVNNLWGVIADFAGTPRKYAVGFAMGNQGYVGTGDDGVLKNDFWQYLVFQNQWVQKASMPVAGRSGAVAWGQFPNGYIACGESFSAGFMNDVWEYNYFNNQWTQRTSLPASGRKHAVAFTIGNVAYVGTGFNGTYLDDCYAYFGITGIETNNEQQVSNVYPNPAKDQTTIYFEKAQRNKYQVMLFNTSGQMICPEILEFISNGVRISTENLSQGLYLYSVSDEYHHVIAGGKLIIQ
ncbi:MAG: hypothetical protein Fur0041_18200 [Bacteroidia bacterium]